MNSHEILTGSDGREVDLVRDCYGRFVALIDQETCKVILYRYYEPTNRVDAIHV